MINFYPGPSKLDASIGRYYKEGFDKGIFACNHRSNTFQELLEQTKKTLDEKLNVPKGYEIVMTSSATECWEIIAQSVLGRKSLHLHNGAFGAKWFEYTKKIIPHVEDISFKVNDIPQASDLQIHKDTDIICLTHNETSNGTRIPVDHISGIRERFSDCLIAVDATSSLAGENLDLSVADIWYASVQKCFGLPPGLAVMILSPNAISQIELKNDRRYYNSLPFILDNFRKNQTPYTPNIPSIYLLNEVMRNRASLEVIDAVAKQRRHKIGLLLENIDGLEELSTNRLNRSNTVIAVSGSRLKIKEIKEKALKNSILLGNGYGSWKEDSFRIANFPSHSEDEISLLAKMISS